MRLKNHPFASRSFPGALVCDVASMVALVKTSTDALWLGRVIKSRDTHKTVRLAAVRRLRWVNKAVKALIADCKRNGPNEKLTDAGGRECPN